MILLSNEQLYDPTTLPELLIVCESVDYLAGNFEFEGLSEEFLQADFTMMNTAIKVL